MLNNLLLCRRLSRVAFVALVLLQPLAYCQEDGPAGQGPGPTPQRYATFSSISFEQPNRIQVNGTSNDTHVKLRFHHVETGNTYQWFVSQVASNGSWGGAFVSNNAMPLGLWLVTVEPVHGGLSSTTYVLVE